MSQSGQGSQFSLTVAQVVARLRVTDRTIRRHIEAGQSHLILGAGSTSSVMTNQLSRPCFTDALDKMLENGDAIVLHIEGGGAGPAGSRMKLCAQLVTTSSGDRRSD
jgi:hypothetical protein